MPTLEDVGAILIGGVFVWAGLEHFLNFGPVVRQLPPSLPSPALLLATASLVEMTAGLCLAGGYWRSEAAVVLIAFTCIASLLLLDFWLRSGPERQMLRSAFIINIAVIGGLLLAI